MENSSQDKHIRGTLSQNSNSDNLFPWTPEIRTPTRPWGQLVLMKKKQKTLGIRHRGMTSSNVDTNCITFDLYKEEYSVGKQGCDLNLTEKEFDPQFLKIISRRHFIIKRKLIDNSPVYLENLSNNGTYINCEKVNRGSSRILDTLDEIAFSIMYNKVFVFHDWLATAKNDIPDCIRIVYFISKEIGSGSSGTVHSIFNKRTCEQYAMKHIIKIKGIEGQESLNDPIRIMNEVQIMRSLNHPFVVNVVDIVNTPQAVCLVLEFMDAGDLHEYVVKQKHLEESDAKHIFYQIAEAMKYLHSQNIAHRDLKPQNILLRYSMEYDVIAKISDFGLSKFIEESYLRTKCGTAMYIAPEILKNTLGYTIKADIWSLGVILYFCLCGVEPFNKDSDLKEQICNGKYSYSDTIWQIVSTKSKHIISGMLCVDEIQRLSIEHVLKHEWLEESIFIKNIMKTYNCQQDLDSTLTENHSAEKDLQPPLKKTCHYLPETKKC